ncbi:spermidine synthase [Bauldia litoralis]|uniref:Spermidine synthase n=1 Tax=Bauldia litoralis TaxID=665467 RepID=A0A1G6B3A2_9HYPH|nr:fused MFS/spermidine synthase [Bauldia litoralis]SDB15022.1 spermidine synthase [Bauldia litoralis]
MAKSGRAKTSGQKTPPEKPRAATGSRAAILIALAGAVVVAAVLGVLLWPQPRTELVAETGSEPGLIARIESLYNDIYVYKRTNGQYVLSFGAERLRYTESVVNPDDELDLPVYYTQSMTVGLAYAPALENAAIIGLGGGRTAWYHHKSVPDLHFTAVELDPQVAQVADQFFGVKAEENFDLEILDGRVWLTKSDETYDLIMVDAYRGPFVPFHLLTTEFYEEVASHLKPGGIAIQNVEPSTMLFDSAVATIGAAFDNLDFYEGRGNIVIVAYDGPKRDPAELRRIAAERQAEYGFRYDLTQILERGYEPEFDADAEPLTDDFAPVEYLKAIDRHNQKQS